MEIRPVHGHRLAIGIPHERQQGRIVPHHLAFLDVGEVRVKPRLAFHHAKHRLHGQAAELQVAPQEKPAFPLVQRQSFRPALTQRGADVLLGLGLRRHGPRHSRRQRLNRLLAERSHHLLQDLREVPALQLLEQAEAIPVTASADRCATQLKVAIEPEVLFPTMDGAIDMRARVLESCIQLWTEGLEDLPPAPLGGTLHISDLVLVALAHDQSPLSFPVARISQGGRARCDGYGEIGERLPRSRVAGSRRQLDFACETEKSPKHGCAWGLKGRSSCYGI
ncbi:hypothetical protein HALA3H3_p10015 [Halomonas sp. A3H3]|nr:hypothetical protein HALA3H3_p10015 [Halomonas sp. A3H3]